MKRILSGLALFFTLTAAGLAQSSGPPPVTATCPSGFVAPGANVTATFSENPQFFFSGDSWAQDGESPWPPGFALSPSNTANPVNLTGPAPTTPGTYTLTLDHIDDGVIYQTGSCQFTVRQPLQIVGSCPIYPYVAGSSVNIPLQASGGTGFYNWQIASSTYTLTNATGQTTAVVGTAQATATSFTVTLSDFVPGNSFGSTTPATFNCTISPPSALFISGTCPTSSFAVGAPVSIPLNAVGGSGNYAWVISPSNGPLTIGATGPSTLVTGAFATAGPQSFVVTLSDTSSTNSAPATFRCTIQVTSPTSAVQISGTCPTSPFLTGQSFSIPLTASGGNGTYNWTVTGSATPSATTGSTITLSGTATTAGTFTIGATVHDTSEVPGTATFSCTIRVVAPLTISGPTCPITNIQPATLFNFPLTGAGGTGNYTWTLTGPSFLSLTTATGTTTALTGAAPSAGNYPFTVSLSDDGKTPLTAPFSCSLQVTSTLQFVTSTLPTGTVNAGYPQTQLNSTGGIAPVTFKVSTGSLPPGLQLSTAGVITGTPTQAGTFSFTVTATDSGTGTTQQLQSANFQIQVLAPLVNTTACPLPTGQQLQQYNAPLTATGGNGQYVFSLANNSLLPPGLVLNQNVISGSPQGPSDTILNFQLSSGSAAPVTFSCELVVLGRVPVVTVNGFFLTNSGPLATSTVALDAPVLQDVTGKAVLTFTPNVPNTAIKDNPQVQFCSGSAGDPLCGGTQKDASGLLRIAPFTIPAGTNQINLPPLLISNVAGTVQIALTNVAVGGQAITAAPLTFTITRTPPQIISAPTAAWSGQSLQLTMKASSSTCELSSATVVFTAATGTQFSGGSNTLTSNVSLSSLFTNFTPFASDATHPAGGCAFTLNLPFTISGGQNSIASAAITLNNMAGASATSTVGIQP